MSFLQNLIGSPDIEKLEAQGNVRGLVKALRYEKGDNTLLMHKAAVEALGRIGDPVALPSLITMLQSDSDDLRQASVIALGQIGDSRAVEPLIGIYEDQAWGIRRAIIEALVNIGKSGVTAPFIIALRDENTCQVTTEALVKIGKPAIQPLLDALADPNSIEPALEALMKMGESAEQPLINVLKRNKNGPLAKKTVEVWGRNFRVSPLIVALRERIAVEETMNALENVRVMAVEPLINILESENQSLRLNVVSLLAKSSDERAVEPLISVLGDPDCRKIAVEALGQIGDKRAVEPLIPLLKHEDWRVRQSVVSALRQIGDSRAVEPLVPLLKDEEWEVRNSTVAALGQIGDPQAIEPLKAALVDKNDAVCVSAVRALGQFNTPDVIEALTEVLMYSLHSSGARMRYAAALALGKIGSAEKVEVMLDVLAHEKDTEVRKAIIIALGEIGDPRAVEPLTKIVKSSYVPLTQPALESLEKIGCRHPSAKPEPDTKKVFYPILVKNVDRMGMNRGKDHIEISSQPGRTSPGGELKTKGWLYTDTTGWSYTAMGKLSEAECRSLLRARGVELSDYEPIEGRRFDVEW